MNMTQADALSVIGLLCSYDCHEKNMLQLATASSAWIPQWVKPGGVADPEQTDSHLEDASDYNYLLA